MLRIVHKYRRSVLGLVSVGLIGLAMSGFGVNLINPKPHIPYALKVNDHEVSFDELTRQRKSVEERYRQIFGANYLDFIKAFKVNLAQQAIDAKISDLLLEDYAKKLGFYGDDKEQVANYLRTRLFSQGFDPDQYASYLERMGLTAQEFEAGVKTQILKDQLFRLISDSAFASKLEASVTLERENTKYSADYLEIAPETFTIKVAEPNEKDLSAFFKAHSSDFKQPARVSYSYAVISPKDYEKSVEITPDDVQIYYDEHQPEYVVPEEIHLRLVSISIPKDADQAKKDELKKKASEALKKLKDGQPIEAIVKEYSDDSQTKDKGGDLGWIRKGQSKRGEAFEQAAFKLLEGELSDVVETEDSYDIIKLEDHKPSRQKELSEVKGEIEAAIRKREAPSYMAAKAEELFSKWNESNESLTDFAVKNGLKVAVTAHKLEKAEDPDPELKGLTAQVMLASGDNKQNIELGDKSVLVSINEFVESGIPELSQVKDKAVVAYKILKGKEIAKAEADKVLAALKSGEVADMKAAAKKFGFEVKSENAFTIAKPSGIFVEPSLLSVLNLGSAPDAKPDQVLEANGKYYIIQVTSITHPDPTEVAEKLTKEQVKETQEHSDLLVRSLIERLKAQAKIDVNPTALTRN